MNKRPVKKPPRVILVAEDDDEDFFLLRRALAKTGLGHLLCHVSNGHQVVEYLEGRGPFSDRKRFPLPDLLILDLKMPRFDGFDVLSWIHNSPDVPQIPVVVFSVSTLYLDELMSAQLGADGYYVKPSDPDEICKILHVISQEWLEPRAVAERS